MPVPQQGEIRDPRRERGERGLVNLVARDVLGKTRQLRIELLIANYDLFNAYGLAVGEAEFRKNVSYALARLAGVGSERIANDLIIQAVVAGLLEPATLTGAAGLPAVPAEPGAVYPPT
ncbi:hypothetical protein [Streptomyces sp. NPDC057403]|uniref:hypothetical protein n=1 Tax=Streptomyces sp. NPDC057403 TaxID=3346119 RepID=UPI003697C0C7